MTQRAIVTLAVLCVVQLVLTFDDTAVNVAISDLQTDLGASTADVTWVANAYFVAFGGLLLLGGRLGDRLGRRRTFLAGLGAFGAASVACGLAPTTGALIAARFIQGAAAAIVSPSALALITLQFPSPDGRRRAFGVWGAVAGVGGISALVLGGLLVSAGSWRWIFLINAPIVLAVMTVTPRLVSESRARKTAVLDARGAVLATTAVMSLVFGLLRAADHGWVDPDVLVPFALSATLIPAFVWVERRTPDPLVPLDFLTCPSRLAANAMNMVFAAAFFSLAFLTMLHLQRVAGLTPWRAALIYLPHGLALLAGVTVSSRCAAHVGTHRAIAGALVVGMAGVVLLGITIAVGGGPATLLPGLIVTGMASGLGFPLLAEAALAGTDIDNAGLGSALLGSSQQLGGAVGLAALVTLADGTVTRAPTALFGVGGLLGGASLVATQLPNLERRSHDH